MGIAKALNVPIDYALYNISYTNAVLYCRTIPLYDDIKEDKPTFDESKDANNPNLFNDFEDEEIVRI